MGGSQHKSIYEYIGNKKTCNQCGLEKILSEFRIDNGYKNPKYSYYKNKCLKCEALNKVEYRKLESSKEIRRKYERKYYKNRRINDPSYKLKKDISSIIRRSIKNNDGSSSVWKYLPYTPFQLKEHLEKQFDQNMTWGNHGLYWHIDHKIPQILLKYDTKDHINFLKCWELTNLQPLKKEENLQKGAIYNNIDYNPRNSQ